MLHNIGRVNQNAEILIHPLSLSSCTAPVEKHIRRVSGADALALLLFAFFLLLVGSGDGWLRMPAHRTDVAWFFMAGKSWMSGLIPYVDFTDSKGPLLWLIYGLGYLISPHNLYGVFPFEVLFYWLAFLFLYKTALLFLKGHGAALASSMFMGMAFFWPGMHQEFLFEDYGQLFNAVTLYVLAKGMIAKKSGKYDGLWMGLICGAALMMKYSAFLTLLVPAFFMFLFLIVHKKAWLSYLLLFIAGLALTVLPFLIYLGVKGALRAFISEYFINTYSTIANITRDEEGGRIAFFAAWPMSGLKLYFKDHFISTFLWISLVGMGLSCYFFRKSKWLVLTLILWYATQWMQSTMVGMKHLNYFLGLAVFFYGAIMWIPERFPKMGRDGAFISGACVIAFLAFSSSFNSDDEFYLTSNDREMGRTLEKVAYIVNAREKELGRRPTLSYYHSGEKGEHILTNAVAGTRYWSVQAGMTPEMMREHEKEIFLKHPDFVIIKESEKERIEKLEADGYVHVYSYELSPGIFAPGTDVSCLYLYNR